MLKDRKVIELAGRPCYAASPTLGMLQELATYVKTRSTRQFLEQAKADGAPQDVVNEQLKQLYNEQRENRRSIDQVLSDLDSDLDAVIHLVWLMVRQNEGITKGDVENLSIDMLQSVFDTVMGDITKAEDAGENDAGPNAKGV